MTKQPYNLVTIICESFNRYDTGEFPGIFQDFGFQIFENFSLAPTGNSGTSFVCMDSEASWDREAAIRNPWSDAFRQRVPAISDSQQWFSNSIQTRFYTPE